MASCSESKVLNFVRRTGFGQDRRHVGGTGFEMIPLHQSTRVQKIDGHSSLVALGRHGFGHRSSIGTAAPPPARPGHPLLLPPVRGHPSPAFQPAPAPAGVQPRKAVLARANQRGEAAGARRSHRSRRIASRLVASIAPCGIKLLPTYSTATGAGILNRARVISRAKRLAGDQGLGVFHAAQRAAAGADALEAEVGFHRVGQ